MAGLLWNREVAQWNGKAYQWYTDSWKPLSETAAHNINIDN